VTVEILDGTRVVNSYSSEAPAGGGRGRGRGGRGAQADPDDPERLAFSMVEAPDQPPVAMADGLAATASTSSRPSFRCPTGVQDTVSRRSGYRERG